VSGEPLERNYAKPSIRGHHTTAPHLRNDDAPACLTRQTRDASIHDPSLGSRLRRRIREGAGAVKLSGLHVRVAAENNRGRPRLRPNQASSRRDVRVWLNKFSTCGVGQSSGLWAVNNEGESRGSVPVEVKTSDFR